VLSQENEGVYKKRLRRFTFYLWFRFALKKVRCSKIVQPIASSSSHWVLSAANRRLLLKRLIAALSLRTGTYHLFFYVNIDKPEHPLTQLSSKSVKLTVSVTSVMHERIKRCMDVEGHQVLSEFISVALSHHCRKIEREHHLVSLAVKDL
jgi:hypothetical protein